jgi:hypothetical protein
MSSHALGFSERIELCRNLPTAHGQLHSNHICSRLLRLGSCASRALAPHGLLRLTGSCASRAIAVQSHLLSTCGVTPVANCPPRAIVLRGQLYSAGNCIPIAVLIRLALHGQLHSNCGIVSHVLPWAIAMHRQLYINCSIVSYFQCVHITSNFVLSKR